MKNFHAPNPQLFIPSGRPLAEAFSQTTHLCIAAHQDDVEIMAIHGIETCFYSTTQKFACIVVTDGSQSPRTGAYEHYTAEQMQNIRTTEQKKAAILGNYSFVYQLGYPSSAVKSSHKKDVEEDLLNILLQLPKLQILYTHNPADKHETHVAVCLRTLAALKRLPAAQHPNAVYGCEVWRSLDWLPDFHKVCLPSDSLPHLAQALLGVYDSQISGGKRYDLATQGRRLANATFLESHNIDTAKSLTYAMDLTPLLQDSTISVQEYVHNFIEKFKNDIQQKLEKL